MCNRGAVVAGSSFPGSHAHIFHSVSTLTFINIYKQTTEKVPAQSVQISESDFLTVMHQLGPLQRVPSLVEAR